MSVSVSVSVSFPTPHEFVFYCFDFVFESFEFLNVGIVFKEFPSRVNEPVLPVILRGSREATVHDC